HRGLLGQAVLSQRTRVHPMTNLGGNCRTGRSRANHRVQPTRSASLRGRLTRNAGRPATIATCPIRRRFSMSDQKAVLITGASSGVGRAGALEETSLEEAKAQFETNFFGVVRMVTAVLPSMRRQRHGQIINVSSLSGVTSIPFMGIYSASKFAVEGYTEALRMEVKPFNIHVSLTEAGFLKTPMMDKRQTSAARVNEYDPWRQRAFSAIRDREEKGPGPQLVAETILKIISSKTPRLHYLIGSQARFVSRLRWFLPEGTYERAKMGNFGLGK